MKKFVKKVLALVVFVGSMVCLVNILADPAGIFFGERKIREVCQLLQEGNLVAGSLNLSERALQREFIFIQKELPDEIVIGSSRVMPLSSEIAKDVWGFGNWKNHGMSGGGLYDYYGILGCYIQHFNELPKTIVIGTDPWIFNANNGESRYEELSEEINIFKDKVKNTESYHQILAGFDWEKWKECMSPSYFQSSLWAFWNGLRGSVPQEYQVITEENETDYSLRRPDGSIRHAASFINADAGNVEEMVSGQIQANNIYQMTNFKEIDARKRELFENLIMYLKENKIKVVYYLAPFHPILYEYFSENEGYAVILEIESYLREYAKEHGIAVFGSYNPHMLSINGEDFSDAIHLRDNRIKDSLYQIEDVE